MLGKAFKIVFFLTKLKMSIAQTTVKPITEQTHHPFVNISSIQETGNIHLNIVTHRFLANRNVLRENEAAAVYFRPIRLKVWTIAKDRRMLTLILFWNISPIVDISHE